MTARQGLLKIFYPLWMFANKLVRNRSKILKNTNGAKPADSFYDLSVELNDGRNLPFNTFRGKKVLLVNTASNCGYTNQYEDLQRLYEEYANKLVVIGFPANDFKEQEKGSDEDIANFCRLNFGVTFHLAKKGSVVKGSDQQGIFQWLTDKAKNGWNNAQPTWNFSKYLVNEQGVLMNYFDPAVSPLSEEVKNAIAR